MPSATEQIVEPSAAEQEPDRSGIQVACRQHAMEDTLVNLTICEATRGSYCIARAMFVRGPRASIDISPGWAITISAINLAAGVSTATPCAKQPFWSCYAYSHK